MIRLPLALLSGLVVSCGGPQEREPHEGEDAPLAAEVSLVEPRFDEEPPEAEECGRKPVSDEELAFLMKTCGKLEAEPLAANLPTCGVLEAPREQRWQHELPIYIALDPRMSVEAMVLHFALACEPEVHTNKMVRLEGGFGGGATCDDDELRIYAPAAVFYYLVGRAADGRAVCAQGSASNPFIVKMGKKACPLPGIPGLRPPEFCDPCPPWDSEVHCR